MQDAQDAGNSTSMSSVNGTAEEAVSNDTIVTTSTLSCEWLLSSGLDAEVAQNSEIQAQLSQLGAVTPEEEGRIIACIFNSDRVVLDMFEAFAHTSIFRFVTYSRAHVGRGLSGSGYDDT